MLGNEQEVAQQAIQEYVLRKAVEKIARMTLEQAELESKYGMDLETFRQRVTTDEDYLRWLNRKEPLWEEDLAHWIYLSEELKEWRKIEQELSRS
jgi:hypothetical protein